MAELNAAERAERSEECRQALAKEVEVLAEVMANVTPLRLDAPHGFHLSAAAIVAGGLSGGYLQLRSSGGETSAEWWMLKDDA